MTLFNTTGIDKLPKFVHIQAFSTLTLWTWRATFAASKFPCLLDGKADSRGTSAVFQTVTLFYADCEIFPSKSCPAPITRTQFISAKQATPTAFDPCMLGGLPWYTRSIAPRLWPLYWWTHSLKIKYLLVIFSWRQPMAGNSRPEMISYGLGLG
jgi:hypothetical protein